MKKRKQLEDITNDTPNPDEKDILAQKLRDQLHHAYLFNSKSLLHVIPNKAELKQVVNRATTSTLSHTVHAKHQHIRKSDVILEFTIKPSEMKPGERCLKQLVDFNPAACFPIELVSGQKGAPVDTSRMLLHDIRLVRKQNECPFSVVLKCNMFTLIRNYITSYKNFTQGEIAPAELDRLMGQTKWEMPDLPGESAMFDAAPGFDGEVSGKPGKCMKPVGFLEPEYGRAAFSTVQAGDPLMNGIYFLTMPDPNHGHMKEFGVLSTDHAIAVYAQINWSEENIHFTAGTHNLRDTGRPERFLLMERETIDHIAGKLTQERTNSVPLCEVDRIVFELCRYVNTSNWCDQTGCVANVTPKSFTKTYKVRWHLKLEYTLFAPDIGRAIVNQPTFARKLPPPENTKQVEEKIQAEAAQILRRDEFDVDLADMPVDE